MPLQRRQSFVLGQAAAERPETMTRGSPDCATSPRGIFVGLASTDSTSYPGARVSRRALGISSIFLQGLHTTSTPVIPKHGKRDQLFILEVFNSCLLEYFNKVHTLEQINKQLEEKIHKCLDHKFSSVNMWDSLKLEWENIYKQVSEAIRNNARLVLQTENIQAKVEDLKQKFEHKQPFRRSMEEEISSLYKLIDNSNFSKVDLENQIDRINIELLDLTKTHEEDVRQVYNQLIEVDELGPPAETSLEQMLNFIHSHWKKVIEKTGGETDSHQESKKIDHQDKKQKESQEEKDQKNLQTECSEIYAKIQRLQVETESVKALKRGLENSLNDAKHWHDLELHNFGSVIGKLESELADVREDIEQQRCEYGTLLSNKKTLEMEIEMYHGILEREENPTISMCVSAEDGGKNQSSLKQPSPADAEDSEVDE